MGFFSKIREKFRKRKNESHEREDFDSLSSVMAKSSVNVTENLPQKNIIEKQINNHPRLKISSETDKRIQLAKEKSPINNIFTNFELSKPQSDYKDFIEFISQKSKIMTDNQMIKAKWSSSQIEQPSKLSSFSSMIDLQTDRATSVRPAPNIQIRTPEHLFVKICLLGDGAVGKTALRRAYLGEGFKSEYLMTIGADFSLTTVEIDNVQIKFQIWDLAGQPRFNLVRNTYYAGSYGALIVYDRTRPESFNSCLNWLSELWKGTGKGPVPFLLLGNKSDLILEDTLQSKVDMQAYNLMETFNTETIPRKGFEVRYFQTSAKSNQNVPEAFDFLGKQILSWINNIKMKKAQI